MRLRLGEYLAGAAAVVAIVSVLALHFSPGTTGWHAITETIADDDFTWEEP